MLVSLFIWGGLAQAADKPLVVASIKPLARLAQQYYGQQVNVETLLLPSQNPHHASFTPQQLRLLHQADVVIWLGAEAEPYLTAYLQKRQRASVSLLQQKGVTPLDATAADRHHASLDPHMWLDPRLMIKLLPALQQQAQQWQLAAVDWTKRTQQMQQQLAQMVKAARQQLQPVSHTAWLSYHDPWRYLQRATHLRAPLTVEQQLGVETGSRHFLKLAQAMAQQDVHCGLLEPEARRSMMQRLCRGDCQLVPLDPLGRDQSAVGYSQWWQGVVDKMRQCLAD